MSENEFMVIWHIAVLMLAHLVVVAVIILIAVAMGGNMVFRTKKESHERLFEFRHPDGSILSEEEWNALNPDLLADAEGMINAIHGGDAPLHMTNAQRRQAEIDAAIDRNVHWEEYGPQTSQGPVDGFVMTQEEEGAFDPLYTEEDPNA